ncbi:MAG: dipeptidase [Gemmatimonadota bacterium]|nr:dipeptidase [Gemmatimonadota bacterium]
MTRSLRLLLIACTPMALLCVAATAGAQSHDPYLARAKHVLATTPLIDGHNDLPWRIREDKSAPSNVDAYDLRKHTPGHTDFERLKQGMVGAQFWSVYTPGEWRDSGYAKVQLQQIDIARRVIAKYPDKLELALTAADIPRIFHKKKIASLLGLEGGHAIENSLGLLRDYYDLGVRYMTLTHNVTLDWADAALDSARHGGLTPFGDSVVLEMNRLGMLVDLAHVSPGVMSNVLDVTKSPVIFSHSAARAIVDVARNVPDSILRRVPANGGVVMVPFVTGFISPEVAAWDRAAGAAMREARRSGADTAAARSSWLAAHPKPRATLAQVANQIDYVKKIVGPDHIGIGGDFDGIDDVVLGLEDVSKYPDLFAELARRGWSDADLRKLAGENVLRVFRAAERVSAQMRATAR